jgi:hypothetical protein
VHLGDPSRDREAEPRAAAGRGLGARAGAVGAVEALEDVRLRLGRTFARGADSKAYVHCAGGRHRTGSMIGVYRLVRNGWTADRAYAEMKAYDYYKGLFLFVGHKNYVFDYYKRMQRNPSSVPAAYAAPAPQSVVHASGN